MGRRSTKQVPSNSWLCLYALLASYLMRFAPVYEAKDNWYNTEISASMVNNLVKGMVEKQNILTSSLWP